MEVHYQFVNYGENLFPEKDSIVLDVGMKTVPGVIDHHHPEAEAECTASLIVKYPYLVLDHLKSQNHKEKELELWRLNIITHRFPDFDSLSSIFLTLKLIEKGVVDSTMGEIAKYAKTVDSAAFSKEMDLLSTPYSILRALFAGIKKEGEDLNLERVKEGLKFMNFLYAKSLEGYEIFQNRLLFSGIERYERALRKAENDYFNYLFDLSQGEQISLFLPLISRMERKKVDGLIIKNPRSFLLKEWAKRDKNNSPQKEGFTFLMTNFGYKRYILGVDPEKGVNLKGLGELFRAKELEKREIAGKLSPFSWYDGNCPFFSYRIIDSPQDGTLLSHQEIVKILLSFGEASSIAF